MHTKRTDSRGSLFQSTGQSDQLIGDFEGSTWSRVIGWAGFNNWLPGTLPHVPVCSPQHWRPANEEAGSNSPSVAWPYWRAQRSKCGGMKTGTGSIRWWRSTIQSFTKAGAALNTWKHGIYEKEAPVAYFLQPSLYCEGYSSSCNSQKHKTSQC